MFISAANVILLDGIDIGTALNLASRTPSELLKSKLPAQLPASLFLVVAPFDKFGIYDDAYSPTSTCPPQIEYSENDVS